MECYKNLEIILWFDCSIYLMGFPKHTLDESEASKEFHTDLINNKQIALGCKSFPLYKSIMNTEQK